MSRRSDVPMPWGKSREDHAALAGIITGSLLLGITVGLIIAGMFILGAGGA